MCPFPVRVCSEPQVLHTVYAKTLTDFRGLVREDREVGRDLESPPPPRM